MVWETASELNNSHYEILRSADAENWETIKQMNGRGTVSGITTYSYEDDITEILHTRATQLYYRLRQVDYSGAEWNSNILTIRLNDFRSSLESLSVFPNPAKDHAVITGFTDGFTISDSQGRLIGNYQSMQNSLEISGLQPGLYFITSGIETRKLVIE
jgi:hypothetical protein